MKTVLVTGSQGFIGGYLCRELLSNGYRVIGLDNYSKYGRVKRDYDTHKNFKLRDFDLAERWAMEGLDNKLAAWKVDYIIAGAAMIGGISYFHKYAYDLLATNERITANTFDAAIKAFERGPLERIVSISSSMVYEGADTERDKIDDMASVSCCGPGNFRDPESVWPSQESDVGILPSPNSTYGFQKLATEYFCKGAQEQYGLPYTIVRPFNCVGIGEDKALGEETVYSGNVKLQMSHVLPDIVNKILRGQDPLHILGDGNQIRCYTHGKDIARGIRLAMESEDAINEDFNISTSRETTVLELAEIVWNRIHTGRKSFRVVNDTPFTYDVQKRVPDVKKAFDKFGFTARISLEESVDEVVTHMEAQRESNSA